MPTNAAMGITHLIDFCVFQLSPAQKFVECLMFEGPREGGQEEEGKHGEEHWRTRRRRWNDHSNRLF